MALLHEYANLPLGTITQQQPEDTGPVKYVYQRVHPDFANVRVVGNYGLQMRRHVIPKDKRTAAQFIRRATFREAVEGWQSLTPEQKTQWKRAARSHRRSGYNHYISYVMRQIPQEYANPIQPQPAPVSITVTASAHWQSPPP